MGRQPHHWPRARPQDEELRPLTLPHQRVTTDPSGTLERSRITQGRETPPQGTTVVAQLTTGEPCGWRSRVQLTRPLSSPCRATGQPRPHRGEAGRGEGTAVERAAAPTHLDTALQTPTRGARRGRDGDGGCEGTAGPEPTHEGCTPQNLESPSGACLPKLASSCSAAGKRPPCPAH